MDARAAKALDEGPRRRDKTTMPDPRRLETWVLIAAVIAAVVQILVLVLR